MNGCLRQCSCYIYEANRQMLFRFRSGRFLSENCCTLYAVAVVGTYVQTISKIV